MIIIIILFRSFVTSKNERQIAVRELSQPIASVRHRSQWFATVRSGSPPFAVVRHRSQWFATVRSGSPPFAVVRHRSQWFATVRSGSPPFAVNLKLNKRQLLNRIRET
jgi:predicted DNA-binding protein (MmcQ/YjbR family)